MQQTPQAPVVQKEITFKTEAPAKVDIVKAPIAMNSQDPVAPAKAVDAAQKQPETAAKKTMITIEAVPTASTEGLA